ncbi:MAG TPA: FAD:protein FMN transferase [Candidatus Saccharimonadales bacterium]|nr:FAD:protein FMN transferase [Candidatus Saccharimonadales bacterium]
MRLTRHIMGMPTSLDIPGAEPDVFEAAFERLIEIDHRFSTYKNDSEVSRFGRGELKEKDISDELKSVIKASKDAERLTGGYFSAWAGGVFDPSGYVKGWAIAEAGKVIENSGYKTYCLGAGGDILARSDSGRLWNIGIQDPLDRGKILNKLSITDGAVCTSGSYERGAHIINPKTGEPANELLSVTVTGPDVIMADILATACFAMGYKAAEFMKRQKGYQALIIRNRGNNL